MKKICFFLGSSSLSISLYLFYPHNLSITSNEYKLLDILPYSENSNHHIISQIPKKIGIIGCGISGLLSAKTFYQQGFEVEILEKNDDIGGVWFDNYYNSRLQGPYWSYEIPDYSFPKETNLFPKLPEIKQWLKNYAIYFNIYDKIKFHSLVHKIFQNKNFLWDVYLENGEKKTYDFLIIATGLNNAYKPYFKGQEKFKGKIIHNSEIKDLDEFKDKNVIVLGGSKGAWDALNILDEKAKNITSIMNNIKLSFPSNMTWGYLKFSFRMNRISSFFIYNIDTNGTNYIYNYCKPFVNVFFNFMRSFDNDLPEYLKCSYPLENAYPLRANMRDQKSINNIINNRIELIRGNIDEINEKGIITNNKFIPADYIILATGGRRYLFGLGDDYNENWFYRNMLIPGLKNIAFIGQAETTYNPLYYNLCCLWILDVIRGKVKVPEINKMNEEINTLKNNLIKIFPKFRGVSSGWNTSDLVDLLLKDMDVSRLRKKNYFKHYFENIKPDEYKSVLTHRQ